MPAKWTFSSESYKSQGQYWLRYLVLKNPEISFSKLFGFFFLESFFKMMLEIGFLSILKLNNFIVRTFHFHGSIKFMKMREQI